jgi:hypothetical protein
MVGGGVAELVELKITGKYNGVQIMKPFKNGIKQLGGGI